MAKAPIPTKDEIETVPVKRNEYTPPIPDNASDELKESLKDYGGYTSRRKSS